MGGVGGGLIGGGLLRGVGCLGLGITRGIQLIRSRLGRGGLLRRSLLGCGAILRRLFCCRGGLLRGRIGGSEAILGLLHGVGGRRLVGTRGVQRPARPVRLARSPLRRDACGHRARARLRRVVDTRNAHGGAEIEVTADPEAEPDTGTQTDAEADAGAQPQTVGPVAQARAQTEPDTDARRDAEAETGAEAVGQGGTESRRETEIEPGSEPVPGAEAPAEAHAGPEPEAVAEPRAEARARAETEPGAEADSRTQSEARTVRRRPDAHPGAQTDPPEVRGIADHIGAVAVVAAECEATAEVQRTVRTARAQPHEPRGVARCGGGPRGRAIGHRGGRHLHRERRPHPAGARGRERHLSRAGIDEVVLCCGNSSGA
ncbi:hypothetical protein TSST111916_13970 [Tsukamurella strandjordii]